MSAARPLVNGDRADAFMADAGLDAIVGASQANVHYLSGYHCWLDPLMLEWMTRPGGSSHPVQESFALLPRDSEPALVIAAYFTPDALASWVEDVRAFGEIAFDDTMPHASLPADAARIHDAQLRADGVSPVDALAQTLEDRGLADGRIGLDLGGPVPRLRERLATALPRAQLLDCTNLLRLVRMVKSARELELLARSADVNERAGVDAARSASPGTSVSELSAQFLATVAREGSEFDHFSPGILGVGLSSSTTHVLEPGAVLCLDFGSVHDRYFSDAGITVALAEPAPAITARYDALAECVAGVGVDAMKPGVRGSAVHYAMADALAARGITAVFPHGHGLGLELRDYPILVPDTGLRIQDDCVDVPADLELEPGMVINLEATVWVPGVASVEVEVTSLVTEAGAGPLVHQERATPVTPE
jgi:Xaa-Pro aminopeptidase